MAPRDDLSPRARAKRDQIRDGARRLFLQRGFADASTDAIAAEAGVSKQTLYVYYPSKDELFADVLAHLIRQGSQGPQMLAEQPPITTADDVRRALATLAHGLIARFMQPEYLALMRVVFAETPRAPQVGALFRSAVPERVLGGIGAILAAGQEAGVVRDLDRDLAARMLVGPLLTFAILDGLLSGDGPPRPPAPERIEALLDLYMRAVLAPTP